MGAAEKSEVESYEVGRRSFHERERRGVTRGWAETLEGLSYSSLAVAALGLTQFSRYMQPLINNCQGVPQR